MEIGYKGLTRKGIATHSNATETVATKNVHTVAATKLKI
jgi:hypothetical protein